MQLNDFQFELPEHLIARFPLEKRSASRLMCVRAGKEMDHHFFHGLDALLNPGDLLVFNDTKVIPARLAGQKQTGGKVELLVERILDEAHFLAQMRVSKKPKIGDKIFVASGSFLTIVDRDNQFFKLNYSHPSQSVLELIETIGEVPLPPYMHRSPDASDLIRYQTVYARHKGSVAAPTAGLHFDDELLQRLSEKQIQFGYLTLHIGAGTFAPVRVTDIKTHVMHTEYCQVSESLCEQIRATKARGKRVIAVGTTALRALETVAKENGLNAYNGTTQIFIYPGYQFQCVDALITNLHLPRSTLFMLVCAFGGYTTMMQAYAEAIREKYRFYSYGDAMFIKLLNP